MDDAIKREELGLPLIKSKRRTVITIMGQGDCYPPIFEISASAKHVYDSYPGGKAAYSAKQEALADHIVTAANAHHELVEALREARSMLAACQLDEDASSDLQAVWDRGLAKIDAALASAEGGA